LSAYSVEIGKIDAAGERSSRIDRLEAEHRQHDLRDEITRTLKHSGARFQGLAPVTNVGAVTLGAGYGPQFGDLDGISRHFATTASDPDYDIDDINVFIESVHPNKLINHSVHEYEIHKLSTFVKRTALGSDNRPLLVHWVYKHCALESASVIANLVFKTLSNEHW